MNPPEDSQANDPFEFPDAPLPSPKVGAAIRAAVQADARKVHRVGRRPRLALSIAAFCAVSASLAVLTQSSARHELTQTALLGAVAWAFVALGVLMAGFGRFASSTRSVQMAAALSIPALFFVYLFTLHSHWVPLGRFFAEVEHSGSAIHCGSMALMLGTVTSATVFFAWKRTDPFNPTWSGALAGLIGGLSGALSVGLMCPGTDGWHLWLGHGLCVVALAMLGASLGRRVLSP